MSEARDFVFVGEAAKELDVSTQRVRQLTDAGKLPARRGPYGTRLIDRRAVEDLKREREQKRHDRRG